MICSVPHRMCCFLNDEYAHNNMANINTQKTQVKRGNVWEARMMMKLIEFIKGCLKILDLVFHHLSLASKCTCTTLYTHVAGCHDSPVSPSLNRCCNAAG